MAIELLTKSNVITNITAVPKVNSNPEDNGKLRSAEALVTTTGTTTTSGSTYLAVRLMSNDVLKSINLQGGDATVDLSDVDVGVRQVASPNTLDDDAFAAGLDIDDTGDHFALGALGTQDTTKKLWEWAGLTADPGGEFDIHLSLDADATAAGIVKVIATYVRD